MTIDDLLELYVIEHVIPHLFLQDQVAQKAAAFMLARKSMIEAVARGRPFVASDGFRALIVALPGRPLMVADHRTGELTETPEQDFMALLDAVW